MFERSLVLKPTDFPKIIEALEGERVQFVKPQPGVEIEVLHASDTADSPATRAMAVRQLSLPAHVAVPFHRHPNKEKVYLNVGGGKLRVWIMIGGHVRLYALFSGGRLVVPLGCPHAIATSVKPCQILVITSSNDPATEWEPTAEELVANAN